MRNVPPASSASLPFAVAPESPMMLAAEASFPRRSHTVLLGVAVTVPVIFWIERFTDRMANDAEASLAVSVQFVSLEYLSDTGNRSFPNAASAVPFHVDTPDASVVLVPTWLESAIRATESVVGAAVVAGAVVVVAGAGVVVAAEVVAGAVVAGAVVAGDDVDAGADVVDGAVLAGVVVAVGADVDGVVVVVAPDPDVELGTLIGPPESVGSAGTVCGPNVTGLLVLPAALETAMVPAVEPAGTVAVTCV